MDELCKLLDEFTDNIIDKYLVCATEIISEYMSGEEGKIKLTCIMELIGLKCKGVTSNIYYGHEKEINGFVWMTLVMRSNFERYS